MGTFTSVGTTAAGAGEGTVCTALQDYLERLPEPFVMLDIEARIQERTPYVVVALQEVSRATGCTAQHHASDV